MNDRDMFSSEMPAAVRRAISLPNLAPQYRQDNPEGGTL